ncbi:MAG: corrinoid protein [Ignavibacteriales bacterium]|nr:corrinoid protein [Ignavibacteriales bacterium]
MNELLEKISVCVERGKINAQSPYPPDLKGQDGAFELTKKALEIGLPPQSILNDGLMIGMKHIGEKFRENKIFVPDVLISAKAMKAAMELLKPYFQSGEVKHKGSIVLGTVTGDLHDIGKNIVSMVIEGGGWKVIDLGVDAGADKFINAINEFKVNAVGLSALLTTTMQNMETIAHKIKEAHPEVKVLVGGAPLTNEFANKIGADVYSPDPQGALEYLNSMVA